MKVLSFYFLFTLGFIFPLNSSCQAFYDEMAGRVDSLMNERSKILFEINKLDQILLDSLSLNGYYIRFNGSDETIDDTIGYGRKTIKTIKNGDMLLVVGKTDKSIYKVKLDNGVIGYYVDYRNLISSLSDYPIKVLEKANMYNINNNSTLNCSSIQCSATTSKGSRCRNRTTNCSGRCHIH
jgi:hypothetical protein